MAVYIVEDEIGGVLRQTTSLLLQGPFKTLLIQANSQFFFFFNDAPTTEFYPLPLHDALPICTSSERIFFFIRSSRKPSSATTRRGRMLLNSTRPTVVLSQRGVASSDSRGGMYQKKMAE